MRQEHTDMKHTLINKKNSIINCVVIKSYVKVHKDIKNMMKRSSNEKKKHITAQQKRSYIIDLTSVTVESS